MCVMRIYCIYCNGAVCRCCYSIIFKRLDAPRVLQFRSEGKRFAGHAICVYYTAVKLAYLFEDGGNTISVAAADSTV